MPNDGERDDSADPRDGGISRRAFLRGGAVAGALGSAGLLTHELVEAAKGGPRTEAGVEIWGPAAVPVRLRINGKPYDLKLEPRTTLLDALRDQLDLTGAKRVCDRGTCGACTVLLGGKAVYACSVLAVDAQRQPIQTIEGLGGPQHLHPLQAAFVENDSQQCGFCTPGFVMAAKALLDSNPNPSLKDVHRGLSGNFCRCGTYAGMRKAVLAAGPLMAGAEAEDGDDQPAKPKPKKDQKDKKAKGGGHHG